MSTTKLVLMCSALMCVLMSQVQSRVVSVATPVIFTNSDGDESTGDEIKVPNGEKKSTTFCTEGKVNHGWYTPLDNIAALSVIRSIDVEPKGNCVDLIVLGYNPATNGRVRIKIYADIKD